MTKQVDFDKYSKFVDAVTSDESKDFLALSERLVQLDEKGANIERLLTAGVGLNAEAGEFLEIVKKMIFQGKPWSEDNREHLVIELGRTVTPQPVFKKDTIRVRLLQRSLGNPAETFDTEKNWEYDVPWPVEEVKVEEKQPVKEKQTVLEKVKRVIL